MTAFAPEPLFTADGLRLERVAWPASRAPHGTVLVVHGLGEHAERYVRLAADLSTAGWAVQAWDQRGHGASEGARGAIAASSSLLDDLALLLRTLRDERAPRPLVLLGHSMGGVVAARAVAAGDADADALVLSSPAFDLALSRWQRWVLDLAERVAPDRPMHNGIAPQWISRDLQVVRNYVDDTRVHDRITPRLARFIVDAGAAVLAAAPYWRMPTLLLWAGADRCVAPQGSAAFVAAAPLQWVQARCFDGLAHEIFNEPERDLVVGALIDWLGGLQLRRVAAPTSGDAASRLRSFAP
jgi:alpha-beta hydrolase superfamily lysophospholipase